MCDDKMDQLRSRLEILIITEYVISNNRKRINWYSQLF